MDKLQQAESGLVVSLKISTPNKTFALNSTQAMIVDMVLTLEETSGPITLYTKDTVFAEDMNPKSQSREFRFFDQKSGQAYQGPPIDLCYMWPILKDDEVSYHNKHNFITRYAGVCRNVRAQFLPDPEVMVHLEAGHSYQIDFSPSWATFHIWWQFGRKWQVLRWRAWPFGRPTYAYDAKSGGSDPPRPLEFECAQSCTFKAV